MSNPGSKMGLRRRPYAFTEQGVAMLSSVLHSDRAIDVKIAIMRAFGHLLMQSLCQQLTALTPRLPETGYRLRFFVKPRPIGE